MRFRPLARLLIPLLCVASGCSNLPPLTPFDCAAPPAAAGKVLQVKHPAEVERYIVSLAAGARSIQALEAGVRAVTEPLGVAIAAEDLLPILGGFRVAIPAFLAAELARDPRVALVERDGVKSIDPLPASGSPAVSIDWGEDRVDQRTLPLDGAYAPRGDGASVDLWTIDTGGDCRNAGVVQAPEDCLSAISGGNCRDGHGHGCHVSATSAGRSARWGVAKGARLHTVKVLNDQGSGSDSDVIRGIDMMVGNCRASGRPCVGSMSLGGSPSQSLDLAVCRAIAAGIPVAVAAGNDEASSACASSPARVLQAVTVGASDSSDARAFFSSTDRSCTGIIDLWAPGLDIVSARPGGGEATMSGTSMATPHVAGALAICAAEVGSAAAVDCVKGLATPGVVKDSRSKSSDLVYVGP